MKKESIFDKTISNSHLIVKPSKIHGYGVFANKAIFPDEIIEQCYLLIDKKDEDLTPWHHYNFIIDNTICLPLGYGAVYNHADKNNAIQSIDLKNRLMIIKATKKIKRGDEIFIHYGDEYFKTRNFTPMAMREGSMKSPSHFWRFMDSCLGVFVLLGILVFSYKYFF